jgi:hypothetical protein
MRRPQSSYLDACLAQAHTDARGCAPMVSRQSSASSSVPERGALRRTEDSEIGGNGGGGGTSWDIFEPRVGDASAATQQPERPNGAKIDLASLKHMTGGGPAICPLLLERYLLISCIHHSLLWFFS